MNFLNPLTGKHLAVLLLFFLPLLAYADDLTAQFALYDKNKTKMADVWIRLPGYPNQLRENKAYKGSWKGKIAKNYDPTYTTWGSYLRMENKSNSQLIVGLVKVDEQYQALKILLGVQIVEDQIVLYPSNVRNVKSPGIWQYETDTGPLDKGTYEVVD